MKREPEILDVSFLREVEHQQEKSEHGEEDGVDHAGQAFEEAVCIPELERRSSSWR